jgi:aminoglycoside phosphotransferase family enzyme/gluconate kinase
MNAVSQMERGQRLVEALTRAEAYQHPTSAIRIVETHCAWVLLTGEFAYKIKKPVNFGFLDFSTLEKRQFYCREEVRLNRRFAAGIYLDVVAVTGQVTEPKVTASGPVLEYAVRMRQFEDDGLLSQLAERKRLGASQIDQMIDQVTEFHEVTARALPDAPYGNPDQIHHWVNENFQHIRPCLSSSARIAQLSRIQRGVEVERRSIESLLLQRKQHGFIRECHGDLHLGNITLIDGRVTLFDCIEFNPELRWIDVFSDVAFLVMDLDDRGYRHFAFRFLNGYLHRSGDYRGLGVLRYYLVYRALVRAKVAMLRRQQAARGSETFKLADDEYAQYAGLAERYLGPRQPILMITFGLSGSGKSTIARQLCEDCGMIQIRSDVERKRMSGLRAADNSRSALDEGLYSPDQTEKTYQRLAELADAALQAGYPVIADATFLQRGYRDLFRRLAQQRGVPFKILHCVASDDELERRIRARQVEGGDASEADLAVLVSQRRSQESLGADEKPRVVTLDSETLNEADAAWWQDVCGCAGISPRRVT